MIMKEVKLFKRIGEEKENSAWWKQLPERYKLMPGMLGFYCPEEKAPNHVPVTLKRLNGSLLGVAMAFLEKDCKARNVWVLRVFRNEDENFWHACRCVLEEHGNFDVKPEWPIEALLRF